MKKLNRKQKLIIIIAIITIIVIIGIVVGANAIRVGIANSKYESSNSDSSNSNLLPEYIKKGITLGGVTGTLEDLDTSDATAKAEDIVWGKTAYVDGKKITGTYLTLRMLNIGDYIAYVPDTASNYTVSSKYSGSSTNQTISQETLLWRILNFNDDGTVELISASPTNSKLALRGAVGYNNGVYLLNNVVSKLYSNKKLNATARNINIDDVEKHINAQGKKYIQSFKTDAGHSYGDVVTYANRYYPVIYAKENGSGINTTNVKKDGINKNDSYYTTPTTQTYLNASKSLTVTQTYYYSVGMRDEKYFDNSLLIDIFFNDVYWIATRWTNCLSSTCDFCIVVMGRTCCNGIPLYVSDNRTREDYSYNLRPIVTLKSSTQIVSGEGSEENPYQLMT